ncbi:MAG: hypothetical protein ABUJ92_14785, partial [Desulfobacterales bacterium]
VIVAARFHQIFKICNGYHQCKSVVGSPNMLEKSQVSFPIPSPLHLVCPYYPKSLDFNCQSRVFIRKSESTLIAGVPLRGG